MFTVQTIKLHNMKQLTTLTLLLISIFYSPIFSQSVVDTNGLLTVSGNQIVNKNGNAVSLAGNSLFWSNTGWGGEDYYTADVVNWLASDWNSSIIRAAMGVDASGGYISDTSNKTRVTTVINAAISAGIYVIIDWHSHYAESYEDEAVAFFKEMAQTYGGYDNIIYEIYNEPLNTTSWSNTIKPYAETVIDAIRTYDSDNLIVVGTPTWSQDVDVASLDPISDYSNIAYSLHFYAGTHGEYLRTKAKTALDNGIALMVTEWGAVNADGDGDVAEDEVEAWMAFLADNKLSHCNWAVNDKSEGASALNSGASTSGNWSDDDDLTASGLVVKEIIKNWDSEVTTSVDQPTATKPVDFEMYPNPTSGLVTVEGENISQIEIVNMVGKTIMQIKNPGLPAKIDLRPFSKGIFLVKATINHNHSVKKLIVR